MTAEKETSPGLNQHENQTIADRLKILVGVRSIKEASEVWGIPYSSLHNYLNRGNEPSLTVAYKIAKCERVPLEWIASGEDIFDLKSKYANEIPIKEPAARPVVTVWDTISKSITNRDIERLCSLIFQIGIEGVTEFSYGTGNDLIREALKLNDAERRQVLRLIDQLKRGTAPASQVTTGESSDPKSGAA